MNVSSDTGSPRVINADAKEAQLREKLAKYEGMEQTYEGEVVQVKILTEDVVRCGECISRKETEGFLQCTHPYGLKMIDGMSFCSLGVREA